MSDKTPRFTLIADGCFRDEERMYRDENGAWFKYEYTPTLNPDNRLPFSKCVELASKCELAGGGWKLASPGEISPLINYQKTGPATDAPGVVSGWHWTDQVDVTSPSGFAWSVNLHYGSVYWGYQGDDGFAVACRRVPASQ